MSHMATHTEMIVNSVLQQTAKEQGEGAGAVLSVAQLPDVQLQVKLLFVLFCFEDSFVI